MEDYHMIELIKFLQAESSVSQNDLVKVEWAYIPLLNQHGGAKPKLLEGTLANDPEFFAEVIRRIYRSNKPDQAPTEPTEHERVIAKNAWQLLHDWRTPPGKKMDGTFSEECFTQWFQKVKDICTESGHLEFALINIGEVLIHTPPDPNGLWIHHSVAAALNDTEEDDMRNGFRTALYNLRGVHWVDPTGNAERQLANEMRSKAETVENEGFPRFAVTLKALADSHDREAERIIANQKLECV
jgi:hypothetical protein